MRYAFWSNKGGTGKSSLCFQAVCDYAENYPDRRVLVIDACPQANLSEVFLGGVTGSGNSRLLQQYGALPRRSLGGYFESRLPTPYLSPNFRAEDFITKPASLNENIPSNIDLVCGDQLLEVQASAMNTLANTQIPGVTTWLSVASWIEDFLVKCKTEYDKVFIDCNPSFAIYTQAALVATDRIVMPLTADDASRRALQNTLSLVYGVKLASPVYAGHLFHSKFCSEDHFQPLPKIHLVVRNRLTQYMGPTSAYTAILEGVRTDLASLTETHPQIFSFTSSPEERMKVLDDMLVSVPDFQSVGAISFARGTPLSKLRAGKQSLLGQRVQVREDMRIQALIAVKHLTSKL